MCIGQTLGLVVGHFSVLLVIALVAYEDAGNGPVSGVSLTLLEPLGNAFECGSAGDVVHENHCRYISVVVRHHWLSKAFLPRCVPQLELNFKRHILRESKYWTSWKFNFLLNKFSLSFVYFGFNPPQRWRNYRVNYFISSMIKTSTILADFSDNLFFSDISAHFVHICQKHSTKSCHQKLSSYEKQYLGLQ